MVALRPGKCESALISVNRIKAARVVHCKAMSSWEKMSGRKTIVKIRARILALQILIAVRVIRI